MEINATSRPNSRRTCEMFTFMALLSPQPRFNPSTRSPISVTVHLGTTENSDGRTCTGVQ